MKRFAFFLTACLFIVSACKNDTPPPVTTPETRQEQTPPAPSYTAESIQQSVAKATSGLTDMRNFLNAVDALPANIKKKYEADINGIREEVSGAIEKQQTMVNELSNAPAVTGGSDSDAGSTGATDAGGKNTQSDAAQTGMPNLSPATIQDYLESFPRYEEAFKAAKARLEEITGKKL